MIKSKKVVVVMPAYNASETLEKTYTEIPFPMVDEVILVDDHGSDDTYELAKKLGINHVIRHQYNKGYVYILYLCSLKLIFCQYLARWKSEMV